MSGILDLITSQLGSSGVGAVSKQIGADESTTQKAVAAALPMLIGGLARNANKSPEGAAALSSALDRDHDGSVIDNVMSLLGGSAGGSSLGGLAQMAGGLFGKKETVPSRAVNGDGILKHVLGAKRGAVEQGISKSSGLDIGQVTKLLPVLAPLVMGALGKAKKQQNLDPQGLASMLSEENARVEKSIPGAGSGGLAAILDRDGDGDITDDLAKLGSGLLSKFG